jgi:hypothetical protein
MRPCALAPLAPLDELRRFGLRLAGRPGVMLFARREVRVTVVGTASVVTALVCTGVLPLWSLVLGPIALGVPHLIADLRYLVLRPGVHLRRGFAPFIALPLAATLIVPHLSLGLVAVAGACALARTALWVRIAGALAGAAAAVALARIGRPGEIVFAHVHNLVALGLWWSWRPRRPMHQLLPVCAFAAGALAIGVGLVDTWSLRSGALAPILGGRIGVEDLAAGMSPFIDPVWALRALLLFAFGQSVHYAVWLRLVPEDDRPRPAPRPFTASVQALVADCGGPLLAIAAAVALGLVLYAAFDAYAARMLYLRLALFHGPLELVAIALRVLDRTPIGAPIR